MRNRVFAAAIALVALVPFPSVMLAQTPAPAKPTNQSHVDLAGDWGYGIGRAFGLDEEKDTGAGKAGTAQDKTPYQPWALAKMKSERFGRGEEGTFANTTDPHIKYCDPIGTPRIWTWPSKFKFLQTPDAVFIIYEYGMSWRVVWLNRNHPDDPDPTWWGDSVGKYEGPDTLVVDTIGFNDKTWLDMVGRPHSDKLHLIERFRRVDKDRLEITLTIDDPGAYTKPWTYGPMPVKALKTGFARGQWICALRENDSFDDTVEKPTVPEQPAK
jgi:hypothetical protein